MGLLFLKMVLMPALVVPKTLITTEGSLMVCSISKVAFIIGGVLAVFGFVFSDSDLRY